uniref:Apple domain-containing protein n=2 Tax=Alexandrium monilatum TaxID=311494 RepID=A0A7S4QXZ9_9DINO
MRAAPRPAALGAALLAGGGVLAAGAGTCFVSGKEYGDPALAVTPNGGYVDGPGGCQSLCQTNPTCNQWTYKAVGNPFKGISGKGCWVLPGSPALQDVNIFVTPGRVVSGPRYCPAAPGTTAAPGSLIPTSEAVGAAAPAAPMAAPATGTATPAPAVPAAPAAPAVGNSSAVAPTAGTEAAANGTDTTASKPGGSGGFPWWAIVLVAAAAAILVGAVLVFCSCGSKKASKKKKKAKRGAEPAEPVATMLEETEATSELARLTGYEQMGSAQPQQQLQQQQQQQFPQQQFAQQQFTPQPVPVQAGMQGGSVTNFAGGGMQPLLVPITGYQHMALAQQNGFQMAGVPPRPPPPFAMR